MTDFTKQVGWSPSVPASPASITVATDNGDGTGYITNPDGTVVPVVTTPTVDTFATLAGNVITFADGATLDVTPTVDTNISAVALEWDAATSSFVSTVTEDGSAVVGSLVLPDGDRECGDKVLVKDPATNELEFKPLQPEISYPRGTVKSNLGAITEDITVGGPVTVWLPFRFGGVICETITNNSCETLDVFAVFTLVGLHDSELMDSSRSTIHRQEFSIDGGVSWLVAHTNIGMVHEHSDTLRATTSQIQTQRWSSPEFLIATLPAGSSIELCSRAGYILLGRNSVSTSHTVGTDGEITYRTQRA